MRPAGFEPATLALGKQCSIQLSYGHFLCQEPYQEFVGNQNLENQTRCIRLEDDHGRMFAFNNREHASGATGRLWMLAFPFVCTGIGFSLLLICVVVEALFIQRVEGATGVPSRVTGQRDPPRSIPWHTQVAWLFVVAFVFVFLLLDGPACWGRLFDIIPSESSRARANHRRARARITGIRPDGLSKLVRISD